MRTYLVAVFVALAISFHGAAAGNLLSAVQANPNLSTYYSMIQAAGLTDTLSQNFQMTLFAPSNTAFANMPAYKVAFLKDPANAFELKAVLNYHLGMQKVSRTNFYVNEGIPTNQGGAVFVEYIQGTLTFGLDSTTCDKGVKFEGDQLETSNGYLNVIDTVMTPTDVFCNDRMFFVEQRGAGRVGSVGYDCRSKGTDAMCKGQEKPVGVAVDSKAQKVFWSNDMNAKPFDSWISMQDFSGSEPKVIKGSLYDPQGLDVDPTAQQIYYTQHQGSQLNRMNYDGTGSVLIHQFVDLVEYPADVQVDAEVGLIFVQVESNPAVLNGTLVAMRLDGSGYTVLAKGLIRNYGLCLDRYKKHVYYIQGGHGGSVSCHAYGSKPCDKGSDGIVLQGLEWPYMCDVDSMWAPYGGPTNIIFSEPNVPGSVYTMTSNGTELQLIDSDLDAPMGVKLGCMRPASL